MPSLDDKAFRNTFCEVRDRHLLFFESLIRSRGQDEDVHIGESASALGRRGDLRLRGEMPQWNRIRFASDLFDNESFDFDKCPVEGNARRERRAGKEQGSQTSRTSECKIAKIISTQLE